MTSTTVKMADLHEGQHWDEVGSPVVNTQSRKILTLGTKSVTYEDESGRKKTILITSFLRWAKIFAECSTKKLSI
jgi:hypothetical protein